MMLHFGFGFGHRCLLHGVWDFSAISSAGEIPFDNLRKCELIARCQLAQDLVSVPGESDGSVLAEISPRSPNHRLQLFPLLCIEKPVTPALQCLGGWFFVWELIPGR